MDYDNIRGSNFYKKIFKYVIYLNFETYNSTKLLNFVKSEGIFPVKFLLDKWLSNAKEIVTF